MKLGDLCGAMQQSLKAPDTFVSAAVAGWRDRVGFWHRQTKIMPRAPRLQPELT
jgi:hypothetical protein